MMNDFELLKLLAWGGLLYLMFCFANTRLVLFASVNATTLVGSSLWIVSGNEGSPTTKQHKRHAKSDPKGLHDSARRLADHRDNVNNASNIANSPNPARHSPTFPPDPVPAPNTSNRYDVLLSPKEDVPCYSTLMKMYEDIIAADAETMQVQQGTIHAQQDIIRSQADMILRLQQLVGAQDAWIEEHLAGCQN